MAQFDVHRNRGPHREELPFVVVVQSSRLDGYRRRVVVPLVLRSGIRSVDRTLNPSFKIEGTEVVLHPLEIVSVAVERLGEPVGSLVSEGDRILAALDVVISRAYR